MSEKTKMTKAELARRYILFLISLFISAFGIACAKKAELGVPPISSVSNVLSMKFDFLSLGNWLMIWNFIMIAAQVVILRKDFKLIQLLQVPVSFLFGWFTDLGMSMLSGFEPDAYPLRLLLVCLGTVILGFGISLAVVADVIMNSGEAVVKAVADKTHFAFGNVKIGFDIFCLAAAVILSLIFFPFTVRGIREGTAIAAVCTGLTVKFFGKTVRKPTEKIFALTPKE